MVARLFTLEDADRLLPLVRPITRDAVRHYRAAHRAIDALEPVGDGATARSLRAVETLDRLDRAIAWHLGELSRLLGEADALGCHLRDYTVGVVEFPAACLDRDGFVYYTWTLGEARVSHWRSARDPFEARRPAAAAS